MQRTVTNIDVLKFRETDQDDCVMRAPTCYQLEDDGLTQVAKGYVATL